jgi:hypothetical protein
MDSTTNTTSRAAHATTATQRVLAEGAQPLVTAARAAGLLDEALPSLKTLLRAAISRKLDAVKVAGRWLTSAAAIRRWVEAAQHRRERFAMDSVAADLVLDAFDLGRAPRK